MKISRKLDCRKLQCPMPIVKIVSTMKDMKYGEILEVLATDPAFTSDIKALAERTGNNILEIKEEHGEFHAYIQKLKTKSQS